MDRLLITNVNGFLGAGLAAALVDQFEVLGLGDQAPADARCRVVGPVAADSDLPAMVHESAPQWVIHCGSVARSSWDWGPSTAAHDEADKLASLAAAAGRLTVLSTDAVFTGPRLFHAEQSPVRDGDPLVGLVRDLETAALEAGALVVRTHAYGWSATASDDGFAQRAWNALEQGQPLRLSADRHASPIFVDDLAELLLRAYRRNLRGLYHIAGGERTSQHQFAVELAVACGFDPARIVPLRRESEGGTWTREETSLDSRRARRALDAPLSLVREGLARFARRQPNAHSVHPMPVRVAA
ncbi:MAG: sugar nucleotide-binding protein [Planctomycetes bacterium]|nr:sugar nucleotide-binding protein [Planctomycetota bacterium]